MPDYTTTLQDSGNPGYVNRILVGTPVTGLVRVEWVQARYGQIIPVNWSQVQFLHYLSSYMPLRYQVADAQNVIVGEAVKGDFEWLLLWEHDVIPKPDATIKLNEYMLAGDTPVVSGLYYTRSRPSEPLLFRGQGRGAFLDWQPGEKVWVDAVPTGFLLIHMSILREMYRDAEPYTVAGGLQLRRVFDTPRALWFDPVSGQYNVSSGTSDLDWCKRVIEGGYFKRAGWPKHQEMRYPFLVDTGGLFCRHINPNGEQFP